VLALGTVVILVVGGILAMGALHPPPDEAEGAAQDAHAGVAGAAGAAKAERVDPFAGLAPDLPPAERRKQRLDTAADTAPSQIEPGSVLDVPAWRAIVAISEEAKRALKESNAVRGGGDLTAYREKAKAAKALYAEIVDKTRTFREELRRTVGIEDRYYRRVDVEYARWTEILLALKKDAGL
jgi:hypothetical protein